MVNPSLRLSVGWTLRRRNAPIRTTSMTAEHTELIKWLLDVMAAGQYGPERSRGVPVADDVLRTAVDEGMLIRPQDVPGEPSRFRCEASAEIMSLVPKTALANATAASDLPLWLNPCAWVQRTAQPPAEIRDRAIADDRLRSHLPSDAFQPLPTLDVEPPLAWIEHPFSGVLQPLGLGDRRGPDVAQLLEGARSVSDVSCDTRDALLLAGALLTRAPTDIREDRDRRRATSSTQLAREQYVVLRDVVSPLTIAAMRSHWRRLRLEGYFQTDDQQVKQLRDGMYCELGTMLFQRQLTPLVAEIVAEPIKPSYAWVFRYKPGAMLKRHVDRPQCKWNISLCVDTEPETSSDQAWPFFVEVNGQAKKVMLGMGDAVLYSGTDVPHWRGPLSEGHHVTLCFFHYVAAEFSESLA